MDQAAYIQERLDDQIAWYSKKSQKNKQWYRLLQVATILMSATIPFLTGYITETTFVLKIIVGVIGLTVAAITAILGHYKFQENWVEYRTTAEELKHEKFRFLTGARPYNVAEPFRLLVDRVEGTILEETMAWSQKVLEDEDDTPAP